MVVELHKLHGSLAYVAGPMDLVEGRGAGWRQDMTKFLNEYGMGVLNPCDNPIVGAMKESENYFQEMLHLKESGDWQALVNKAKRVVRSDLHLIDISNFVICYLDVGVHSSGTNTELTYAAMEKKPVILVCKQGKRAVPNFLWGLGLDHNMFFGTFEEAKEYILHVAYDDEKFDGEFKRWRFIDFDKVFGV